MITGLVTLALRPARGVAEAAARATGDAALTALDAILASRFADEAVQRVLASPLAEEALDRALASPLAAHAVEQIDPLATAVMERLLANEQLWVVVDEIAGSAAVTEAITQQSVGFADQVAGELRVRVMRADTRLEQAARRVLRRPPGP